MLVAVALDPRSSVTVAETVYVPGTLYTWLALEPVAIVPSPKLICDATTAPSTSLEPTLEAETVTGAIPELGVTFKTAVGGWFEMMYVTALDIWFFSDALATAFTSIE